MTANICKIYYYYTDNHQKIMNITIHQLNVLKTVAQHGSLTAAANTLHITQPAVSNILKQLERCCDFVLTETIGKKIFLTDAGNRLVDAAEEIHAALEAAKSDINALDGKLSGNLTVAIVSTAKYFVPKLLGEFRKQYPLVRVKLTVCNRHAAIQILKDNTCDFLVMSQAPENMSVDLQPFYRDQLVVAASPEARFKNKIKTLADLNEEEWIIREPGSGTRIVMKKLFKAHKMAPTISMEVSNNESIKQLLIANMGISIISKQSIELELEHNLVKIVPVANFPMEHDWYFVMNKGKQVNRVINTFFDFVKSKRVSA